MPLAFYNESYTYFQAVEEYCSTNGLPFLFLNKNAEKIGLDFAEDFADQLHLNWKGQVKMSLFMGEYIQNHYQIQNKKGNPDYSRWDQDHAAMMGWVNAYLEQHPIIDIKKTAQALDISYNTAASAIRKLADSGILRETTNAARNRVFAYQEYLDILRKDT